MSANFTSITDNKSLQGDAEFAGFLRTFLRALCAPAVKNRGLWHNKAYLCAHIDWKKCSAPPHTSITRMKVFSRSGSHKPNTVIAQAYYNKVAGAMPSVSLSTRHWMRKPKERSVSFCSTFRAMATLTWPRTIPMLTGNWKILSILPRR